MYVTVMDATENPVKLIANVAGVSTRHVDDSISRVDRCFRDSHMGVFEHAEVTLLIKGISRACSHQLVRHRMASFVQESQRYTKIEGSDWYVKPPAFTGTDVFDLEMHSNKRAYDLAIENGVRLEDARYLLPEATKTNITMTINARSLFHFLDLRTAKNAQWEIRELAEKIKQKVSEINGQWRHIIELWEKYNGRHGE